MARIFIGSISGGGGGSTNPTTGIVPVNQFGTFQDSVLQSTINLGNGVFAQFDDAGQIIQLVTGTNSIVLDETITELSINGNQINIVGNAGIGLFGGVDIHNHLSNPLLRFLSNGASDPALKSNGTTLEVRNGNDTNYLSFKAGAISTTNAITTGLNFILSTFGSLGASADGTFTLLDNAGATFNRLCWGRANASYPALKRNGTDLQVRLGDDSADSSISAKDVTASGTINTSSAFNVTARSILESLTNGNFTLYNQAKSTFVLLQFGGATASFPALKRSTTELQVRLADDSNYAPARTGNLFVEGGQISASNGNLNIISGSVTNNTIIYGNLNGISIGKGNTTAVASAKFEIVSTDKGFLPPRMTSAQRTAISSPAIGLMVYQTDPGATEGIWTYKSTGWVQGV